MNLVWLSSVFAVCALLPGFLLADGIHIRESTEKNTEATLGQLPYLISVWKEWSLNENSTVHTTFYCTGALVHPEYVLTSLSCAEGASRGDGRVLAAGGHLSIADDPTDIEFHAMSGWIPHEEYDTFSRANNIALIKVSPPFVESSNIKVASVRSTLPAENTECTISGWREDYFETSTVLKTAQVRVLAKSECKYLWEEDEKYPQQVCAGIPKSESPVCNVGDEGGPLLCEFAVAGLYADNQISVCIGGDPNPYLDVSFFSDWIATNLAQGITASSTTVSTPAATTEGGASSTETVVSTTEGEVSSTESGTSSTEGETSSTQGGAADHTTGVIYHSGTTQVTASLVSLLLTAVCLSRRG